MAETSRKVSSCLEEVFRSLLEVTCIQPHCAIWPVVLVRLRCRAGSRSPPARRAAATAKAILDEVQAEAAGAPGTVREAEQLLGPPAPQKEEVSSTLTTCDLDTK